MNPPLYAGVISYHPDFPTARLDPATGAQGATVSVTLTGTHFLPGTTVTAASDSGLTVSNLQPDQDTPTTKMTFTVVLSDSAKVGTPKLNVTTKGGSATTDFQVTAKK